MRFQGDKVPTILSPISLPSATKVVNNLSNIDVPRRTIQQIKNNNEAGTFWVLANIVSVESFQDWWYLACKKCNRKVQNVNQGFLCSNCNIIDSSGCPRFKIQVRVQDDTDNTLFLLWDQHCVELIGKTVTQVLEESQDENTSLFPDAFTNMFEKEIYFKIQVKEDQISDYNGAYNVKKLTQDKSLISKLSDGLSESQGPVYKLKLHNEDKASGKFQLSSSEGEVGTPQKKPKDVMSEATEESRLKRKLLDEFSSTTNDKQKVFIKQEDK